MSASPSNGVRPGIFGYLKGLFRRSDGPGAVVADAEVMTEDSSPRTPPPVEVAPPGRPAPKPSAAPTAPRANTNTNVDVQGAGVAPSVALPLQAVLNGLPPELRSRVRTQTVGDLAINIPVDKILSQLPQGQVRLPFGEIRKAAPQVFSPGVDYDRISVALPLNEVLSRLNPGLLMRRNAQRQFDIPEEITSPFSGRGEGLSVGNAKPVQPAASAKKAAPVPPAPGRGSISTPPPAPAPAPQPAAKVAPEFDAIPPLFTPKAAPAAPAAAAPAAALPEAPIPFKPVTPTRAAAPQPAPVVTPAPSIPMPTAAIPVNKPAAPVASSGAVILTSLRSVSENWPEALQQEIGQAGLSQSKIALPVEQVETALKRGRVLYPWKTIRSWISPAAPQTTSAHDTTELELPLKVVAPLFLSHKQSAGAAANKVAVDQAIPDLFFGGSQPPTPAAPPAPAPAPTLPPATRISMPAPTAAALSSAAAASSAAATASAAAAAAANSAAAIVGLAPVSRSEDKDSKDCNIALPVGRSEDTNYYLWNDASDTTLSHIDALKKTGAKGTEFVKRYSSPNEIVNRAAAMEGVAGALVALPDGLMVASRIPAEYNGDTLAAFMPQIFAKVSISTKELRMGELNNVSFTVGHIPWKIFRVNAIFFAVFGQAAKPMPTAQLAALAAELDRKK